jgi:cell division protein FtsZ
VACPLLEGIDLSGARGVLVLIAASEATFKLNESKNAMNCIRRYAADDAYIIYGAAFDESLGDQLRVTVIATGLSHAKRSQTPLTVVQSHPVQRTGTDNVPAQHQPTHNGNGNGNGNGATVPTQPAAPDYGAYATPSVWRSNRAQAAARVEALSSNGMDEIEIPAFLRKQAD